MEMAIFTEDSGVKYPERKDNKKFGKGVDIEEIPNFTKELKNKNLEIPSTNLENEEKYKNLLSEFVRPAKLMFAGLFKEVRNFYNELNRITKTELYIISGRYGLVRGNKKIIPYKAYMEDQEDLKKLDKRTNFSIDIVKEANKYDLNLFFLTTRYLNYLISEKILEELTTNIFIVTGSSMKNKIKKIDINNLKMFRKKGISRIGWQNRKEIKNIINEKYR